MPKLVWLNGKTMPMETATVSAADHAHLYGDGLFEGIRIYNSKVFKLDEHLSRAYYGCRVMGFEMSMSQADLRAQILETCSEAGIENGYIRLNITRGTGLGLDPSAINREPNVMIMINTLALYGPEKYEKGLEVVTTSYRTIPADSLDPRLKCIGRYASNILAKQEANRQGAGEGLMLNHEGYVAECTGDNIFWIKDGVVHTPLSAMGLLEGITRNTVIQLARANGIEVREGVYTRYDIFASDEAFLTGTAAEVIPMVALDGRLIGDGTPGNVSNTLIRHFREHTKMGAEFSIKQVA
jgi:branched-chain amino acid aminotransferase